MIAAVFFIFIACVAVAAVFVLWMRAEDRRDARYEADHKAPRRVPSPHAGAARAWRRVLGRVPRLPVPTATRAWRRLLGAARRLPGATRRLFERDLDAYDRETLALLPALNAQDAGGLRALHHAPAVRMCSSEQVTWRDSDPLGPPDCGETVRAANRQALSLLSAPEDVPGRDGQPGTPPPQASAASSPAGDQAPGPDGLPEGDTHPPWPPQETTGPGDLTYTDHLAALAAILADLAKPADEERWPDPMPGHGYSDETGSFERIVAVT